MEQAMIMTSDAKTPAILTEIPRNARALMLTLKWVDFILKKIPRKRVSDLLRLYTGLGWISEFARYQLMGYFRGSLPDPDFEELEPLDEESITPGDIYGRDEVLDDYRLTATDHIKSRLFIMGIKGLKVDSHLIEVVEEEVKSIMKYSDT